MTPTMIRIVPRDSAECRQLLAMHWVIADYDEVTDEALLVYMGEHT